MHASALAAWSNFYVIAGSAAAALTGLMFVVATLAERLGPRSQEGIATFSTPTVAHFAIALLISFVMSAPWRSLVHPAILVGLAGAGGLTYLATIALRTRRLAAYRADVEDWTWYMAIPTLAYLVVLGGAIRLSAAPTGALFPIGGAVALLIFVGIRNAWDVVTYVATGQARED